MPLPKFNNCGLPTTRLMQEHLDSLTIISKEVMQIRRNRGVIIEPLEPDDSDEERQLKRKMRSKYKLRFVNKVCGAYHTRDPIKADDGSPLKVALFDENNIKITYGPLSSASVQIVVLHGDFNDHGQDYWTSEEFSRYEVCPRSGEVVLGGNCILVLADGEACLGDAFFQMTSYCARTAKFKMGIRLASAQEERIQEGVSEQFWVKYRHFAGKALVDNDYQEQNNPMPNLPYRSQINAGNRLDIIWGRSQLPFPGSNMLSTEPSTSDASVKKGPWTPEEDKLLVDYIKENGHGSWRRLPKLAGLNRCGKSCRLRWTNYLRPDIKRDHFTDEEEKLIIHLLSILGNKWSSIAPKLPGRTDNEIKNYWYTHLRKKLLSRGIDPVTHRPPNLLAGIPNLLAAGIPNLAAAAQTTWDISTPCGEKTPASSPFEGLGNLNLDDEFNSDSSCRDLLEQMSWLNNPNEQQL
ncbi:hypothetical protein SEVIR_8G238900v4 [Setaria viridis]|uniref:Uncharacterized protein n=1 Tax=Setaria viridis TaxID=4556 RepID=A0A4U6TIW7_SETVI|nr:hypothetical protein SEVIR_8G238900v2 [Setaria viridis]